MKDWLDLNRRDFLAALTAAYGSAAGAWAAPRSWFVEYAGADDESPTERNVSTLCTMCPGGCGLNVRVVHGCAVGIRGNKSHPINRGGLCSRASATLQDVYNPDRLHHPLRRVGPRGSGRWEKIDWDTATGLMSQKLRALRAAGRPEQLCVILGRDRGLTRTAWTRFARAFGSPNVVDAFPEDNLAAFPAVLATHGVQQRIGYDLSKARFVLSFSSGWLDAHWSTEQAARGFAEFRRGRPGFRPRWVHFEPRLSLTATKADEWLPIHPGTEGTVALGIAHVMLREGLFDDRFVKRHGSGFDDWVDADGAQHLGFRQLVLREYSPANVQRVTGVPEGAIFRLAREFSTNRPAVALGFDGGGCGSQATYDRMAIHCLNALVGSIDVPGGITVFREFSLLEGDVVVDEVAARGLSTAPLCGPTAGRRFGGGAADHLVDSMTNGPADAIGALFILDADPVFELVEGDRLAAAFSRVPFTVAVAGYHNDTNRHADLILPSLHGLHRWDFNVAHTLTGHPVATISKPVMSSMAGGRDPFDIVKALALQLGNPMAEALPWTTAKQAVDAVCRELFEAGRGAAFGPANEESWAQLLESRGWRAPFAKNLEEFKRTVLEGGGWTDPIYFHREWDRVFRSPAARFGFSSTYLARSFEAFPDTEGLLNSDRRCLPDCPTQKPKHDADYPLELFVYALPNLVGVSSPNLPWLKDIAGAYMFEKWRTWVEIHPETAERYGLAGNDRIEVRTARGKLVLPVKIYSGLMHGVIAIPFGLGHETGGRWCAGIGENPARLVEARHDPLSGKSLWNSTRAAIRKA